MAKILNNIELFAGCGGLIDGFEQTGKFRTIAAVEWQRQQVNTLINYLENKYRYEDAKERVLCFDIQRTDELIGGWKDERFGSNKGLDFLVNNEVIDIISGGPPCQAYSLAGRIRDSNNMRRDYRNFLFESYVSIVAHYRPKLIVFENVEGILSAIPTGEKITDLIAKEFDEIGYEIVSDLRGLALLDLSEFAVPQNRKRVIIIGVRRDNFAIDYQKELIYFYKKLNAKKSFYKLSVREAIGDLPPIYPLNEQKARMSHNNSSSINGHFSRFHNLRDQEIFYKLALDIEQGEFRYLKADSLIDLYFKKTGKKTNVHKYYVLRWDEQSNTIPAHLKKDGLRHIHPDPQQKRSITVREAARLQTFPDDFLFTESMVASYEMIGNAVPPKFAKILADTVYDFYSYLTEKENH